MVKIITPGTSEKALKLDRVPDTRTGFPERVPDWAGPTVGDKSIHAAFTLPAEAHPVPLSGWNGAFPVKHTPFRLHEGKSEDTSVLAGFVTVFLGIYVSPRSLYSAICCSSSSTTVILLIEHQPRRGTATSLSLL